MIVHFLHLPHLHFSFCVASFFPPFFTSCPLMLTSICILARGSFHLLAIAGFIYIAPQFLIYRQALFLELDFLIFFHYYYYYYCCYIYFFMLSLISVSSLFHPLLAAHHNFLSSSSPVLFGGWRYFSKFVFVHGTRYFMYTYIHTYIYIYIYI